MSRIVVIQGHPDNGRAHLCHFLADCYAEGAAAAGHEVERVDVAALEVAPLRRAEDYGAGPVPEELVPAHDAILAADHIFFIFPLWMGFMPAVTKVFFEQMARPRATAAEVEGFPGPVLKGKSVRMVVTMGMPAWLYRLWFGARGVRSIADFIFGFVGAGPVRTSYLGSVEAVGEARRKGWGERMRQLGAKAR